MIPKTKSKADANPTKAFFVRMITRDITLEDCIFDLIDNSIDGAWALAGGRPMSLTEDTDLSAYKIGITITHDSFEINDNCGGITLDDAVDYAFTFGRKETADIDSFSIGVYGIGMKRAVFKLGTQIEIRSTYTDQGKPAAFKVPIDVDKWLTSAADSWDFDIEESEPLNEFGVCISVNQLTEVATRSFESPRFVLNLQRMIARDYAIHLHRGLRIEVNGKAIPGWNIALRQGGEFAPMRATFVEDGDGDQVYVDVIAGMVAAPPDSSEPTEEFDDNQDRSGWYVVCNGRIVLAADKTKVSGWGTEGWPQWHPQYSGFMGIIFFSSRRADLLPLTTTKRSVDETSAIYRNFRPRMRDATRQWINYTNDRKQERDEAKRWEEQAKAVPLMQLTMRSVVELPKITPIKREPEANILYTVPRERLRKLAAGFGNINMPYKDVGLQSFKYAFDDLVGDE